MDTGKMDIRKKLIYQSHHRGTAENDRLLGDFADAAVLSFSDEDLKVFEKLLNHDDSDLFAWITGQQPIPEDEPMVRRIREFHQCP